MLLPAAALLSGTLTLLGRPPRPVPTPPVRAPHGLGLWCPLASVSGTRLIRFGRVPARSPSCGTVASTNRGFHALGPTTTYRTLLKSVQCSSDRLCRTSWGDGHADGHAGGGAAQSTRARPASIRRARGHCFVPELASS